MRNEMTTARRTAFVAVALLALFLLHTACPFEPSHHTSSEVSAELCHHGEPHHESAAPTQAAVQSTPTAVADLGTDAGVVRPFGVDQLSCPWRSEPTRSGRALLLGIGISRT